MKWYHYIGTLVLAFIGYCAVFPVSNEQTVAGVTTEVIVPAKAEHTEITFAEIDANGTVLRVIVADQSFIDSGSVGDPQDWVKVTGTQKNRAGEGYTYDKALDIFVTPKTEKTTLYDAEKAQWYEPVILQVAKQATST